MSHLRRNSSLTKVPRSSCQIWARHRPMALGQRARFHLLDFIREDEITVTEP
jgi:hypothetical protein